MIRVGFWYDYGLAYAGGLNYFRNLLYAVRQAQPRDLEIVLFMGRDIPAHLREEFGRLASVEPLDLLTRGTAEWALHRSLYRSVRWNVMVERVLRRHRIDVVSHPSMVGRLGPGFKLISWIPDFQYLHLPHLFPGLDAARRSREIRAIHRHSDAVVLSSRHALGDFAAVVGEARPERTHVLPFVSQPSGHGAADAHDHEALLARHGLPARYFLLPNQFWAHKNHRVAFEAVARLKRAGLDVTLACTGWIKDPHQPAVPSLAVIEQEGLQRHVRLLGSIDYRDVIGLMRGAVAVLNPSLFEGWSSSVEEARSMGKAVIVSDIAVHREQAHPQARYFDPHDPAALAEVMKTAWLEWPSAIAPEQAAAAHEVLKRRTREFGERYVEIVREVAGLPRVQPVPADSRAG